MSATVPAIPGAPRLLRISETLDRTGLRRTSVYQLMSRGEFPRAIRLGSTKAVGWLESDVNDWIARQVEATRKAEEGGAS